jgi:hypothetical protein
MTNRWTLTEEVKQKYTPIVEEFINKLEPMDSEDSGAECLELSDTELSPYTLVELLGHMGYKQTDADQNGWQMDYWLTVGKSGFKTLCVSGTAITFGLRLSLK